MTFIWLIWIVAVIGLLGGALLWLCFTGGPLQPSYKETLIRHAEEQHAAIMNGDDHYGTHGTYPPEDLS